MYSSKVSRGVHTKKGVHTFPQDTSVESSGYHYVVYLIPAYSLGQNDGR